MKYYIPTTNLNIDNLLSTESISPYAYYAERKFKPNYFENIFPSLCDSVLLLFSKIPSFELDDKEVEQLRQIVNDATGGIKGKGFMFSVPALFIEGLE